MSEQENRLKNTSNTLAIISLILGIVSLLCNCISGFTGVIGIILGVIALCNKECTDREKAVIGIITSSLAVILSIILTIAVICGIGLGIEKEIETVDIYTELDTYTVSSI